MKEVVEIFACREVVIPEFGSRLNNTDQNARTRSIFASSEGADKVCKYSLSLDIFMLALVTALENIKKKSSHEHLPPILQDTFFACSPLATNPVQSPGTDNGAPVDSFFLHVPGRPMPPFEKYSPTPRGPRAILRASAREILENWFNEH